MSDERTAAERENMLDGSVLDLLRRSEQCIWSQAEVEREHGRDVTDSLDRLYGGGMIHRLEGFVWASRAALMAEEVTL